MIIRHWILLLAFTVGVTNVRAQYDPSFSHYFDMETDYNPAAVGKQSQLNVTAGYALDLAGFEHNPQTAYAAVDMPFYALKTYHGGGVQFMNDKLGLFTHQRFALQYALKFRLFTGQISAGIQAGMISENFDGSKVDVEDANDPAFATTKLSGNILDFGAGLRYTHHSWYVGMSVMHLTSPLVSLGERHELQIDRTYYLTGGGNIKLRHPFLTIKPSFLMRTDMVTFRSDITARLIYSNDGKIMYGGLSYSPSNSVTALVGGSIHGVLVGYSYEVYTSAINPGNGSHEIFIGYQHEINLAKKGKALHKSVRIL